MDGWMYLTPHIQYSVFFRRVYAKLYFEKPELRTGN